MFTLSIPSTTTLCVYQRPAILASDRTTMDVVLIAATICFILLAVGFGVVFARLISRERIALPVDESDAICSPTRYRVMERLLAEADQKIVASLGDRRMARKFRRVRVKIFRSYVLQLAEDFNRICKAIKLLMVTSQGDRPDLAGFLLKQQLVFSFAMMSVELKLLLYGFGWSKVDLRRLAESVDAVCAQLRSLSAMDAGASITRIEA